MWVWFISINLHQTIGCGHYKLISDFNRHCLESLLRGEVLGSNVPGIADSLLNSLLFSEGNRLAVLRICGQGGDRAIGYTWQGNWIGELQRRRNLIRIVFLNWNRIFNWDYSPDCSSSTQSPFAGRRHYPRYLVLLLPHLGPHRPALVSYSSNRISYSFRQIELAIFQFRGESVVRSYGIQKCNWCLSKLNSLIPGVIYYYSVLFYFPPTLDRLYCEVAELSVSIVLENKP